MMMNHRPDKKCSLRTTLIIVPAALLDQWKLELELKTNVSPKCLIYHGSKKPKQATELLKYDFILTTYGTMSHEWSNTQSNKGTRRHDNWLFEVEFYRVVLDEAHCIRNKQTNMSQAATALKSTYRWCLSGTPFINSVRDFYSLFRFLHIPYWSEYQNFDSRIGKLEGNNPLGAIHQLQNVLRSFTIRRKKDSKLKGKVLVELPPKTITLQYLEFSVEEREIYNPIENKIQMKFNRFLKAGTVLRNYSHVLAMLLRLRQCCVHPWLIQEEGLTFITADGTDGADEVLKRARDLISDEFVRKVKDKFLKQALSRLKAERASQDAAVEIEE
ncbi:hypothetical protein D9757_007831 [Collybiopsis confluens]|uniref:Helicase ATP-binding domain-containing protein n=1 Tax=Collybiopsis confluens TaxID=2823264 RepID=A0A8H5MAJ8_9AGAR|nr:hypothetical protein D9757_007831 [Collybiopsis confluens]